MPIEGLSPDTAFVGDPEVRHGIEAVLREERPGCLESFLSRAPEPRVFVREGSCSGLLHATIFARRDGWPREINNDTS